MLRTLLALALASSGWAETICSRDSTICDGSYSGTELCATLPPFDPARPPCAANKRRAAEGGHYLFAGLGRERRREGTEGGPRVGVVAEGGDVA